MVSQKCQKAIWETLGMRSTSASTATNLQALDPDRGSDGPVKHLLADTKQGKGGRIGVKGQMKAKMGCIGSRGKKDCYCWYTLNAIPPPKFETPSWDFLDFWDLQDSQNLQLALFQYWMLHKQVAPLLQHSSGFGYDSVSVSKSNRDAQFFSSFFSGYLQSHIGRNFLWVQLFLTLAWQWAVPAKIILLQGV